jgi:hypothetical protein
VELRCRPGCLALITNDHCDTNLGRLVQVHGPAILSKDYLLTWLVAPVSDVPYALQMPGGGIKRTQACLIELPDVWLLPVCLEWRLAGFELEQSVQYLEVEMIRRRAKLGLPASRRPSRS